MYDVTIIGAGIIGCSIARELSKYNLKICLLEKDEDVSTGATKANSGIVHGGYAEKPGSVKAKFSYKGNQMYEKLNCELNFGFSQTGSFVIGFDEKDAVKIQELFDQGKTNGVKDLQIVDGDFVKSKEPHLNKDVSVALYCPTAGITSPYEFAIALAENAIQNGATLKLNSKVTAITKEDECFVITSDKEAVKSKIVINCAGVYADEIAKLIGIDDFSISPRQGQYLVFDKDQGESINSVIFQVPTEISKGILVTRTQHGNMMIGPDATPISDKDDLDTCPSNINEIIKAAKKSLPDFDLRKVITAFSGNRMPPSTGDFIIEESKIKGFINAAGIESPGLTAAPAIALYVAELVEATDRVKLEPKTNFDPYRKPYNTVENLGEEELAKAINKDKKHGCIVCRCETVSEGEICDAINRNIPINSLDAIKRRTRAGMGRCQGGFCTPKIMDIINDETKTPKEKITKKGSESFLVTGKTKQHD